MRNIFVTILIASCSFAAYGQDLGESVAVSSSVGDTITPLQRNRLGLFPGVNGFKWAVFFLSGDSILNAKIGFGEGREVSSDTVIRNYGTLRSVHYIFSTLDTVSADSAQIMLKDGTMLSGTILGETSTKIVFLSARFGQVVIRQNDVQAVARRMPSPSGGYVSVVKDPNGTRAFVMPTASTPPAGEGYIGDYELIFLNAAVGVTDWLMINAGTLLLPLRVEDMIFDYGFKARVFEVPDKFGVAVGLQMIGGGLFNEASGIGYGVISIGNFDNKLNFAAGDAFSGSGGKYIFGFSGDARLGPSIKIMAEMWILQDASWSPLVVGFRFFGGRIAGDIGLLYPIGEKLESPIGIPVVSVTYTF